MRKSCTPIKTTACQALATDAERKRQLVFVQDLTNNIRDELLGQIREGKVPTEWDGHELRVLLASRFEQSAKMSVIKQYPQRARARDYRIAIEHVNT
jgi:hypothetical protein